MRAAPCWGAIRELVGRPSCVSLVVLRSATRAGFTVILQFHPTASTALAFGIFQALRPGGHFVGLGQVYAILGRRTNQSSRRRVSRSLDSFWSAGHHGVFAPLLTSLLSGGTTLALSRS